MNTRELNSLADSNNVIKHDTIALTSQTGAHLSHWIVPGVLNVSRGYDREKALEFINEKISLYGETDYGYYENSKIKTKVALSILSEEGYFNIVFALGKSAIINIFSFIYFIRLQSMRMMSNN